MKEIALKYFSGTGNSLRVLEICSVVFKEKDYDTALSSITDCGNDDYSNAELIGFCFPVYAFSLPRICMRFLKSLPRSENRKNAFLLVTAGAPDESGFALVKGRKILEKKGYSVIYSDVINMPSNWITFDNPPEKDLADKIIKKGQEKARDIACNIMNGNFYHHEFNVPERMNYLKMYFEYISFHYMGIHQMWKMFIVNSSCSSCGSCEKLCPTKSITLKDGVPCWNSSCEQCMRCVNFCPKHAISQTHGGETKDKNRYHEPHFNPLRQGEHNFSSCP